MQFACPNFHEDTQWLVRLRYHWIHKQKGSLVILTWPKAKLIKMCFFPQNSVRQWVRIKMKSGHPGGRWPNIKVWLHEWANDRRISWGSGANQVQPSGEKLKAFQWLICLFASMPRGQSRLIWMHTDLDYWRHALIIGRLLTSSPNSHRDHDMMPVF